MSTESTKSLKQLSLRFLKEAILAFALITALQMIFQPAFADDSTPASTATTASTIVGTAGGDPTFR